MEQYEVIALSVGAKGNKIFYVGEKVNEEQFIPGRARELVELGFLKRLGKPPVNKTETTSDTNGGGNEKAAYDDITKKEIVADLTKAGAQFRPGDNKKVLYDLWLKI